MFKKMLGLGVVALGVLLPMTARAAMVVDLRFADGSKIKTAAAGTYAVNVWAQVTGTNATSDEQILDLYGAAASAQIAGGTLVSGTSGITGNAAGGNFTITSTRGAPGTIQNTTADGISDWGVTSTGNTSNVIKYNTDFGDSTGTTYASLNSAGTTSNAITNGVEWLVGTLTVTINGGDLNGAAGAGAATAFNWLRGTGTIPSPGASKLDGSASNTGGQNASVAATDASTPGNGVLFTVPEPASMGLIGLASLSLLGSRRRKA